MKMKRRDYGFTLVEIMTVMFIIALLISAAIIEGAKMRKLTNESLCQANLKAIASGFEIYAASHLGAYAQQEESDLGYLVSEGYLNSDFTRLTQMGSFHYIASSIGISDYDIRAMAVNMALADHNYQITNGGVLKRSDTSSTSDTNFKKY